MPGAVLFILTAFVVMCKSNAVNNYVVVELDQGRLLGEVLRDRKGGTFYSFQSIPYAKPPIGVLRFKAPEKAEAWNDTRYAIQDVPQCYQQTLNGTILGEEDCLYLNVYTPELPTLNVSLRSVMVYIHGGGLTHGSARRDLFSPEFLLPQDIVLVTINYRLGILGGFSLEDKNIGVPGNAGMKDQVMALRWVQDNIAKFSGDPGNVTLFGQSAGACSVHMHVLSPMSKGLFHRAILQSGAAISPWIVGVRNNGLVLAALLDISTGDWKEMLQSLRNLTAAKILEGQQLVAKRLNLRWGNAWNPVVEVRTDEPSFLTEDPYVSITTGNYNDVPLMIGYNDAEGIAVEAVFRLLTGESGLITNFFDLVPNDLGIKEGSRQARQLAFQLQRFYYGNTVPARDNLQPFIQIYTDSWFGFPAYRAAREHANTSKSEVYLYRFSADSDLNVYKRMDDISTFFLGAAHSDELGYLFQTQYTPFVIPNSVEDIAIDRVVKLWANFAKYGTPTPDNGTELMWLPVTKNKINYIDIGTFRSVSGLEPDAKNMRFWSNIYSAHFHSDSTVPLVLCFITMTGVLVTQFL